MLLVQYHYILRYVGEKNYEKIIVKTQCSHHHGLNQGKFHNHQIHAKNLESFLMVPHRMSTWQRSSFVVENSLTLLKVPKLLEFAQFLSKDVKALNEVKMERTAATVKLKDGLSVHQHHKLVSKMKSMKSKNVRRRATKRRFPYLCSRPL